MWGKCLSIFYHAHKRKSIFSGKKVSARILCYVVDPDIIGFVYRTRFLSIHIPTGCDQKEMDFTMAHPNKKAHPVGGLSYLVGVSGFEPEASWTRTKRDTKLRHTPIAKIL